MLALIDELGLPPISSTSTHYICYCPFHPNSDTPAFNLEKNLGIWRCWNPSCGQSGNLIDLIMRVHGVAYHEALRYVIRFQKDSSIIRFKKKIKELTSPNTEFVQTIPESALDNLDYRLESLSYMFDRGFDEDTIRYFGVGRIGDYICIPVRDAFGRLIGISKRTIIGEKRYLDHDLPKSKTLFNINNAIKHHEVIIVEGPFDAMRVHQSGFPNVVATMMGHLSDRQANLLNRNFDTVIIFTDNDLAGKALAEKIINACKGKRLFYVPYLVDVKDPCDMTPDQAKRAITGKKNLSFGARDFLSAMV